MAVSSIEIQLWLSLQFPVFVSSKSKPVIAPMGLYSDPCEMTGQFYPRCTAWAQGRLDEGSNRPNFGSNQVNFAGFFAFHCLDLGILGIWNSCMKFAHCTAENHSLFQSRFKTSPQICGKCSLNLALNTDSRLHAKWLEAFAENYLGLALRQTWTQPCWFSSLKEMTEEVNGRWRSADRVYSKKTLTTISNSLNIAWISMNHQQLNTVPVLLQVKGEFWRTKYA